MNNVFATFDWPPAVTTMLAVPAVPGGVVHVIDVAETTVTLVQAEPPTVTVAPLTKFVPVIVIAVPPAVEPDVGFTDVTVGEAAGLTTVYATACDMPALSFASSKLFTHNEIM